MVNSTHDTVQVEQPTPQWHLRQQKAIGRGLNRHVLEMDAEGERRQRVNDKPRIFKQGDVIAGVEADADELAVNPVQHVYKLADAKVLVVFDGHPHFISGRAASHARQSLFAASLKALKLLGRPECFVAPSGE